VRKAYDSFLGKHPRHANARVAYAAFLEEIHDEEAAEAQLKLAVLHDPNNPAALNNLANHFGHHGNVTNAFPLYERAIQLSPNEPLYYDNLATTVFSFRRDAMEHYQISEPEVFTKSLNLYRQSLALDPTNFDRAMELAKTYYGVRLPPIADPDARRQAEEKLGDAALAAWKTVQQLASNDAEREGVRLHFARWQINLGRLKEARENLEAITNATFSSNQKTLLRKLESRETNSISKPGQ
jgi:tetratricopeptide (TPR) repeat protein